MARRSDHTRPELRALFVEEGHRHLADVGFAKFSGREVAKRIGYSVGTIYNVFGSLDGLLMAINTQSFVLWTEQLRARLAEPGGDRIRTLVEGYFAFASEHPNLWMAIYDHRLPEDMAVPDAEAAVRAVLTQTVAAEIAAALPDVAAIDLPRLTHSLVATVHGHCSFAVTGTFALLGEMDPVASALARVREVLAAHA